VNQIAVFAYTLAIGLILFGCIAAWFQRRAGKAFAARTLVPSDEQAYFRGRYRRRFITSILIAILGAMIGGAYLTGLEPSIDKLAAKSPDDPPADPNAVKEMTPEQKQLVRTWGAYWIVVSLMVFVVLGFAFTDAMATRRYWLTQLDVLRDDHETKLRRDLAVYMAQRDQNRMKATGQQTDDAE
jgi:MFS family permease